MHKNKDDRYKIIGVFSYQGHVGVTHFALVLASYFSSKKGKKVWYIEVGKQYTIQSLSKDLQGRYIGEKGEFIVDRITFFPNVTIDRVLNLLQSSPDIVIMDFGRITKETEELLKKCQARWLICDFSLWKQEWISNILMRRSRQQQKPWSRCWCFFGKKHVKRYSLKIFSSWVFVDFTVDYII